jgi:hypothetical protein
MAVMDYKVVSNTKELHRENPTLTCLSSSDFYRTPSSRYPNFAPQLIILQSNNHNQDQRWRCHILHPHPSSNFQLQPC